MVIVNKGIINRYENGTIKVIPSEMLQKLANALGYSFDDFVSGDPKYRVLSNTSQNTNIELSEEDKMVLSWYHHLPDKYQSFLKQLIYDPE